MVGVMRKVSSIMLLASVGPIWINPLPLTVMSGPDPSSALMRSVAWSI